VGNGLKWVIKQRGEMTDKPWGGRGWKGGGGEGEGGEEGIHDVMIKGLIKQETKGNGVTREK
jgi:hypothetical protein